MRIRLATLDDVNDLSLLETRVFDPQFYHLMHRSQFLHLLTKGHADILIAEQNAVICGMLIILYRTTSQLGRMYSIAVDPDYQGGEVGKRLFDFMEEHLKKRNMKGVILEIRAENTPHLERYKKRGYCVSGSVPDYYPDGSSCLKLKKTW